MIGPETRRALWLERCRLLGVDPTSADSIGAFQRDHELEPDGVIGPETQGAMRALRKELRSRDGHEELEEEVDELGERERYGLLHLDPADPGSVREFQQRHGLEPDGVIGPATQGAIRSVLVERQGRELDEDERPPERLARGGHGFRPSMSGGIVLLPSVPQEDQELDREVRQLLRALRERGPLSKSELRNAVRAKQWGPGRLRYALKLAEREGLVRRTGRDRYAPARRGSVRSGR